MKQEKHLCRICQHQATQIASHFISYMEGVYFDIYHCADCDTNFVDTDDSDLTAIYQHIYAQADKIMGYNRYYYYFSNIKDQKDPLNFLSEQEAMYWAVKQTIEKLGISKQQSILEVGSGLGYLTYALVKAGYNAKGIDISEEAVTRANAQLGHYYEVADIFEMAKDQQRYDFIVLNEVIEHVPDPKAFVSALMQMLKPGGRLLVTTPDKSVSIPGHPWDTDLPPVHLWWLSPLSMTTIAGYLAADINFVDFRPFNKRHFDKMRFKIYTPYKRYPALDASGKLMHPQSYTPLAGSLKDMIQRYVANLSTFAPFTSLLTRKEYPSDKNSTMGCVFTKR